MAFSSSSLSLSCSPNVTPLIDVLLVLLIIFMVIIPVAPHGLESQIPAEPPTPISTPTPSPSLLEVLSSAMGHGAAYRLDGQYVDRTRLQTSLRGVWAQSSRRTLLISGDSSLDYQSVADVVGEAKTAGFQAIGLLPRRTR